MCVRTQWAVAKDNYGGNDKDRIRFLVVAGGDSMVIYNTNPCVGGLSRKKLTMTATMTNAPVMNVIVLIFH